MAWKSNQLFEEGVEVFQEDFFRLRAFLWLALSLGLVWFGFGHVNVFGVHSKRISSHVANIMQYLIVSLSLKKSPTVKNP